MFTFNCTERSFIYVAFQILDTNADIYAQYSRFRERRDITKAGGKTTASIHDNDIEERTAYIPDIRGKKTRRVIDHNFWVL